MMPKPKEVFMVQKAGVSNPKEKKEEAEDIQKSEGTISERFTNAVIKEFGVIGKLTLTPFQRRLAQHLFIKIDATLTELEKKRTDQNRPTITWHNVNMQKLAVDAVHRIELGLDALIPNHISPIPYLNGRTKKYDLDLRVGYVGKDYYRREMALNPPIDIIYEIVYENDVFKPIKKSQKNPVESYEFEIPQPFSRGKVVGGFAYLIYDDDKKNQLVIVTEEDFKKSENKAQSKEFWSGYPDQMRYKTIVNRATNKLQIDPGKVNAAFMAVEKDDAEDTIQAKAMIEENANKGDILEIEGQEKEPEEKPDTQATAPIIEQTYDCPEGGGQVSESQCLECTTLQNCPAHKKDIKPSKVGRIPRF